jgi:Ca2+-binding RTX toxin-like protein
MRSGLGRDGEPGACRAQNTVGAGSDTLTAIENLTGSSFNDGLAGSAGNNTLSGGRRRRHLDGGAGTDTLNGGPAPTPRAMPARLPA